MRYDAWISSFQMSVPAQGVGMAQLGTVQAARSGHDQSSLGLPLRIFVQAHSEALAARWHTRYACFQ